jgi:hypothetical protein
MTPDEALKELARMGINTRLANITYIYEGFLFERKATLYTYFAEDKFKAIVSKPIEANFLTASPQITRELLMELAEFLKDKGLLCGGLDTYGN